MSGVKPDRGVTVEDDGDLPALARVGEAGADDARCETPMKSDWYKTTKQGTYLIVPAGVDPLGLALPEDVRSLLEEPARLYSKAVSSAEMARSFDFLGVEDCLRTSGYCVLRS